MARRARPDIAPASRLRLWNARPHSVWALKRGLIDVNPCAEGGKLYHGTRVDRVWPDADIESFLAVASAPMRLAMMLAINTGQRQGDLRRLPGRPTTERSSSPPAQDRRPGPGPGFRRAEGRARRRATDKPGHAGQRRRQAMVGIRLSKRMGQATARAGV